MQQEGFAAAVRRIVDVKVSKDGTKYFRICWKDTWEPETHLLSCQNLLDEFLEKRNQGSENVVSTKERSQQIQCDLINTTTSKISSLDDKANQTNTLGNSEVTSHGQTSNSEIPKLCDFSVQYNSCCANTNDKLKRGTVDSFTQCSPPSFLNQVQESVATRDTGCQCEPAVRHFSVQKQESKEEKPEVAEVSVQAEPTVCCTSTQYFDPVVRGDQAFIGTDVNTLPKILTQQKQLQQQQHQVHQEVLTNNDILQNENIAPNNHIAVPPINNHQMLAPKSDMLSTNLIEIDYSQIPAEVLQQILQNAGTGGAQIQQKITEVEHNAENLLKPMYFVVDGNTNTFFEQQEKLAPQAHHQTTEYDANVANKKQPVRGRKRKPETEMRSEKSSKQRLSKAVHSRNLFQRETFKTHELQPQIIDNHKTLSKINPPLTVLPTTANANVYQALRGSPNTTLDPQEVLPQNLNESNVSIVSTVYDPSTPSLNAEVKTNLTTPRASKTTVKTPAMEGTQMSPFETQEKKINEDFISKYWN